MPAKLDDFTAIAQRERCPFAVIGEIDDTGVLVLEDRKHGTRPVDLPLEVLFGKAPKMLRDVRRVKPPQAPFATGKLDLRDAAYRLLRFPAVADKTFLISIGDRTVGGMISRDQMVGPWQVPVADVAVTIADYFGHAGEAMSMGERTPVAVLDAPASGRLAVGEALTNILAADVGRLSNVKLSANWMAACGEPGEDAALYATVHAVGEELCPGARHRDPGRQGFAVDEDGVGRGRRAQVRGRAGVADHLGVRAGRATCARPGRRSCAPISARPSCCWSTREPARTVSADRRSRRCSASSVQRRPICDDPQRLTRLAAALHELRAQNLVLAYHDRSDGGVFVTLVEMAFAGHCGLEVKLPAGAERRRGRVVLRRARRGAAGESRATRRWRSRYSCGTGSAR